MADDVNAPPRTQPSEPNQPPTDATPDPAPLPTAEPPAPTPSPVEQGSAPAAQAAPSVPATPKSDTDARLDRIIGFVKTLDEKPNIHRLLCVLLDIDGGDAAA